MRSFVAVGVGGLVLAAAFPDLDLHPLAWLALVPLFGALQGVGAARALWLGVTFGVTFRIGTMYWVIHAMTEFGGLPLPAALAAAAALIGYLAIYPGLFALGVRALGPLEPGTPFLAAALWAGLELLQARLFTGFPWLLLGYAGGRSDLLVQATDIAGVFGLSFLVVAVNGALAVALLGPTRARRPLAIALALVALTALYGGWQLGRHGAALDDGLAVAMVQGNVAQEEKWDAAGRAELIDRHLRLSERAAAEGADLVVWAEAAWPDPYGVERSVDGGAALAVIARRHATAALVGTVRVYEEPEGLEVANAALLLGRDGSWRGGYEKVQLVPFGEYLPFRSVLGFLGPLVEAVGELRAGDAAQALLQESETGIPRLGISICYEIVFPWIARDHVRRGAEMLVTLTNDAWYGDSSAPWQHLAMARVRAVETRRWLLRAANTGVSAIIDPAGRVVASSGLFEEALVSARVGSRAGSTLYVRIGDAFGWACLIAAVLALAAGRRTRAPTLRSTVRA